MNDTNLASPTYAGDLGDGLVRRWSTPVDTEEIARLLATVHRNHADDPPNERALNQGRLFMSDTFPYMGSGDFAVVEDTRRAGRPLVACTCLWRHRWSYAGIPFEIGRPEYVATDADYRNRGLVRALFDMVHARSAAEGHLVQAITGIPYFYRQFGYEYVLDLEGGRTIHFTSIPDKKGGEPEPWQLRPAVVDDIPRLRSLYDGQRRGSLLWQELDEVYWRFVVGYWLDPANLTVDATRRAVKGRYWMITDREDAVVGSVWVAARRWSRTLWVQPALDLAARTDRLALMHSLLRQLRELGTSTPAVAADAPPCSQFVFRLGDHHPIYDLLGESVALRLEKPYAWYVRVPDLAAFIRHIAPALEERLTHSAVAGHTGDLKIDLYRGGLHLRFEQGKLAQVEPWRAPAYGDEAMAGAPPLVFLQLLLSYRSLDELRAFFPDVWANDTGKLLLDTLFPKLPSTVLEPLE